MPAGSSKLEAATVERHRNSGGFFMIGSVGDLIETEEELALAVVEARGLREHVLEAVGLGHAEHAGEQEVVAVDGRTRLRELRARRRQERDAVVVERCLSGDLRLEEFVRVAVVILTLHVARGRARGHAASHMRVSEAHGMARVDATQHR